MGKNKIESIVKKYSSPNTDRLRICVSCRGKFPRTDLIRLTVDHRLQTVQVNRHGTGIAHGRSAYLCRSLACVEQALKGNRLKTALEGRRKKDGPNKRAIRWPLEPQIIKLVIEQCTEQGKTCQNTQKEGSA